MFNLRGGDNLKYRTYVNCVTIRSLLNSILKHAYNSCNDTVNGC